jgi:hypothetical protein
MKRLFVLIILCLMFTGCATTTVSNVPTPNGTFLKNVKCSKDPKQCMVEASKSCKSGPYQVVSSHSNAGGLFADITPGPVTWYNMSYSCGKSDGRMPEFPFRGERYVAPTVVNVQSAPSYTTCNRIGNMVNCSSY